VARAPVKFLPYDLLEIQGVDIRTRPLRDRRAQLDALLAAHAPGFVAMAPLEASSWDALRSLRGEARERGVEGLMLKARTSAYGVGRQRGGAHGGAAGSSKTGWWKWKIDPYSIDAVMIYAQPGHGRRASLYTDYTFAVWSSTALVPVAKAYSGLSNDEILVLDRWIRQHTVERFGPVRSVEPTQVFELAFEGIAASSRHKAGVALRFPRIARWRLDKPAREADTLDTLQQLL
jgi:DNA ligase 1